MEAYKLPKYFTDALLRGKYGTAPKQNVCLGSRIKSIRLLNDRFLLKLVNSTICRIFVYLTCRVLLHTISLYNHVSLPYVHA